MDWFSADLLRAHLDELLGFAASGATLCAFAQKRMMPMRISAIAANVCFIGYGVIGLVYPVLLLHLILLPLNVGRLFQHSGQQHRDHGTHASEHGLTLVEKWRRNRERFSYIAANLIPDRPLDAANTQLPRRSRAS